MSGNMKGLGNPRYRRWKDGSNEPKDVIFREWLDIASRAEMLNGGDGIGDSDIGTHVSTIGIFKTGSGQREKISHGGIGLVERLMASRYAIADSFADVLHAMMAGWVPENGDETLVIAPTFADDEVVSEHLSTIREFDPTAEIFDVRRERRDRGADVVRKWSDAELLMVCLARHGNALMSADKIIQDLGVLGASSHHGSHYDSPLPAMASLLAERYRGVGSPLDQFALSDVRTALESFSYSRNRRVCILAECEISGIPKAAAAQVAARWIAERVLVFASKVYQCDDDFVPLKIPWRRGSKDEEVRQRLRSVLKAANADIYFDALDQGMNWEDLTTGDGAPISDVPDAEAGEGTSRRRRRFPATSLTSA